MQVKLIIELDIPEPQEGAEYDSRDVLDGIKAEIQEIIIMYGNGGIDWSMNEH